MSAFLVSGSLITDENDIHDMWADPFEALRTPVANINFDNSFAICVCEHMKDIFKACLDLMTLYGF